MRNAVILAALAVASPAVAEPATPSVEGEVVRVESRWTQRRDRIVSATTVRRDDGSELRLLQLGGSVDGIGMTVSHLPAVPRVGDRVRATYTTVATAAGAPVHRVATLSSTVVAQAGPGLATDPGYVNTRTRDSGVPLYWSSGCVYVAYDERGTSHLADEFAVMDQVFATWRSVTADCSYLTFELDGPIDESHTRYDGMNLIEFRDDNWCRPADGDTPEMCYSPAAAALTTLFFVDDPDSSRDGEIVDADIELNGVNFAISHQGSSSGASDCHSDLANTLTHEVGHLLGLDHTCWTGQQPRPVDENGDQVPSCTPEVTLSQEVKDATMYNFQVCGETKKASPEADDIGAVCALYETANDPNTCERVDTDGTAGCCNVAAADDHSSWLSTALLALFALFALRARARTTARRAA